MAENASDFRGTLVELIEASPQPMDHPVPDQWIAYHRGELPAAEEARLQEHLVRCRDCFDLAEGAAAFAQGDEVPAGGEVESAALWRLLRPQLDPPIDPPPQNVREITSGRRRPAWHFRLATALAASFFIALVGLGAWTLSLREPRPNALIVDIPPGERDPSLAERTLPSAPQTVVLHPAEQLPVYRLVIRDAAAGKEEVLFKDLKLDQDFTLTFYLPAGLRPGRYRMELSDGSGGGVGRVLETRLLRVTEAGR